MSGSEGGVFQPVKITGAAHFGLTVSDLDTAVKFWEPFLGHPPVARPVLDRPYVARLVGMPGARIEAAFFELPGSVRLELLSYASKSPDARLGHDQPGHAHVCLWTVNAHDAWEWAMKCGADPVDRDGPVEIDGGQNKGLWAAYLRVPPDAHILEVFARQR